MSLEAQIAVESYMTNPPIPGQFGIVRDGKVIAVLSHEQVVAALKRWEQMSAERKRIDSAPRDPYDPWLGFCNRPHCDGVG